MESDQPPPFAQSTTTTFKSEPASIISAKVYDCGHHLKENGLSFSAFLLCTIFLYTLLCYTSNPSSSIDLLHTNKFWFLLSNTLIIILTIDSGVLSNSSSNAQQKEEEADYSPQPQNQLEFVTNSYETSPAFTFHVSENQEITNKRKISNHKSLKANHTDDINDQPEVLEKTIVVDESRPPTACYINDEKDQAQAQAHEKIKIMVQKTRRSSINIEDRSCRRSKSERISRPINIDVTKKKVPRSQSTKSEPKNIIDEEEVDGFSTMSNEELNKRVEDFITKFYRQQLTSQG